MKKFIISLSLGVFLAAPLSVFADHDIAHTIQQLQAQIQALQAQIQKIKQPVTVLENPQNIPNFSRDLFYGMRNNSDVTDLQEFLTDQGYYAGPITGNFGLLSLSAVKKFQSANGINPTGYFGPKTRAAANKLLSELTGTICQSEDDCGSTTTDPSISINGISGPTTLKVGESGTWKLDVAYGTNTELSYRVIWGDETPGTAESSGSAQSLYNVQKAFFSHAYRSAGTYQPVFYVRSARGGEAKASISVTVSSEIGQLYIEGGSSVGVGQTVELKAFYQPPMPSCNVPGTACIQVMPAAQLVEAQWTSSNNGISAVSYKSGDRLTAVVSGVSAGTAEIKALYNHPAGGSALTATSKISVVSSVSPSITVTSPNGGEVWQVSSTQTIRWSTVNHSCNPYSGVSAKSACSIDIIRLRNSSGQEINLLTNTLNNGSEQIVVPSLPVGSYTLEIKTFSDIGYSISDSSDAPFNIVAPSAMIDTQKYLTASILTAIQQQLNEIAEVIKKLQK